MHYGAPFAATQDPSSGGVYHAFAAGDLFDRIDVPPHGVLECVLQWNDPWGASSNDYDLELWDMDLSPPALIEESTNVQSGTQNPFEGLNAV